MTTMPPPSAPLTRTSTKGRLQQEVDEGVRQMAEMQAKMVEMQAKMQAELDDQAEKIAEMERVAREFKEGQAEGLPPNIKQLLDAGEWKNAATVNGQSQQWWGTGPGDDRSTEVNRLRALATVRRQWPKDTFAQWPQLVVVGTTSHRTHRTPLSLACHRQKNSNLVCDTDARR
jgi:hypothetical protein